MEPITDWKNPCGSAPAPVKAESDGDDENDVDDEDAGVCCDDDRDKDGDCIDPEGVELLTSSVATRVLVDDIVLSGERMLGLNERNN